MTLQSAKHPRRNAGVSRQRAVEDAGGGGRQNFDPYIPGKDTSGTNEITVACYPKTGPCDVRAFTPNVLIAAAMALGMATPAV